MLSCVAIDWSPPIANRTPTETTYPRPHDAFEPIRAPSSARERMPSLRYTRAKLASTVLTAKNVRSATSLLLSPDAASCATSRSVSVSSAGAEGRTLTRANSAAACACHAVAPKDANSCSASTNNARASDFALARRLIRPAISNVRARSKRSGEVSYHDSADADRATASLRRPSCADEHRASGKHNGGGRLAT